jgi:hypothetical protein
MVDANATMCTLHVHRVHLLDELKYTYVERVVEVVNYIKYAY